jgi:hypothetical protein
LAAPRAHIESLPISSESTGGSRNQRLTCPKISGVIAAPLLVMALQRVAELQANDRADAAQVKPRAGLLARGDEVHNVAVDIDIASVATQPSIALVMPIAQPAADDRRKPAVRDNAHTPLPILTSGADSATASIGGWPQRRQCL